MTQLNTDIVVVGAGASGIGAALSAVENGVQVILLEKGTKFGGAGMFGAQGLFAAGSHLQQAAHIDYSPTAAYQEMMAYTHYRSNTRLTKAIIDKSADTIDWLAKNGLKTELVNNTQEVHQDHPRVYHQYLDKFAGFQRLMERFISFGGQLFTQTSIISLDYQDGTIKQVLIDHNGIQQPINCTKVIFADGGFVGNTKMVDHYLKINSENLYSMGERKATGDGIQLLNHLNADTSGVGTFDNHAASVVSKADPKWHNNTIFSLTNLPFLWINRRGQRFVNEDIVYDFALWGNSTYTNGGYYYFVLDQATISYLKTNQLNWTDSFERTFKTLSHDPMTHTVGPFSEIESDLKEAIDQGAAVKSETPEQLASALKIDSKTLKNTFEQYNQMINNGHDLEFNKDDSFLRFKVADGPFYAIKAQSTTLGTIGGVAVDDHLHVLDKDGLIMTNLYATGNNASGMYDTSYPTLEGISCAFAWNSGRIAGEDAAKH